MTGPAQGRADPVTRSDAELIRLAEQALNPQQGEGGVWLADVGAAVEAASGEVFTGASIGGYLATCAEQGALSQVVSSTGPVIRRIVSVWRDPRNGILHVLPPCGRCREAIRTLCQDNLEALVILGPGHTVPLRELLPFHGWYAEEAWPDSEPVPPRPDL